jgi:hypothetical protein
LQRFQGAIFASDLLTFSAELRKLLKLGLKKISFGITLAQSMLCISSKLFLANPKVVGPLPAMATVPVPKP